MKVISISSHKGGVGKTTSTVNIGAAFHNLGKKVLLVDLDSQCSLSESLGFMVYSDYPNIYNALCKKEKITPLQIKKGFDIIVAKKELFLFELKNANKENNKYLINDLLDSIKDNYDYIFIDCAPSLNLLTINALCASDGVLIPVQSEYLALRGFKSLYDSIELVKKELNTNLQVLGVFLTRYDKRRILNKVVNNFFNKNKEYDLFKTIINENIDLAIAPTQKQSIFDHKPNCSGSKNYKALANEVYKKIKNNMQVATKKS